MTELPFLPIHLDNSILVLKTTSTYLFNLSIFFIPLTISHGFENFNMRPPWDKEMDDHQHVQLTTDVDWEPSVLVNKINVNDLVALFKCLALLWLLAQNYLVLVRNETVMLLPSLGQTLWARVIF